MPSKKKQIRQAEIVRLFAARLRERRIGAGLTQTDLAKLAGLTPTYMSRLEAAGAAPGIDTVARVAVALGTSLHDLLPTTSSPDTQLVFRKRGQELFEQLASKADRELMQALVPILARLLETPTKG